MSLKNAARPIRIDDQNLLFYNKVWQPLAALYNENCSDLASHLSTHQTFMKYVLHNYTCWRCSWFQHRIRPLPEDQYEEIWLLQGEYWWGQASLYCIYLFLSSPAKINKSSRWWNHDIMLTRPVKAPHTAQPGVLVCPPLSMNVVFQFFLFAVQSVCQLYKLSDEKSILSPSLSCDYATRPWPGIKNKFVLCESCALYNSLSRSLCSFPMSEHFFHSWL